MLILTDLSSSDDGVASDTDSDDMADDAVDNSDWGDAALVLVGDDFAAIKGAGADLWENTTRPYSTGVVRRGTNKSANVRSSEIVRSMETRTAASYSSCLTVGTLRATGTLPTTIGRSSTSRMCLAVRAICLR